MRKSFLTSVGFKVGNNEYSGYRTLYLEVPEGESDQEQYKRACDLAMKCLIQESAGTDRVDLHVNIEPTYSEDRLLSPRADLRGEYEKKPIEDEPVVKTPLTPEQQRSLDIRHAPANYSLVDVLNEMKFGRPAFDQRFIKKMIDQLNAGYGEVDPLESQAT